MFKKNSKSDGSYIIPILEAPKLSVVTNSTNREDQCALKFIPPALIVKLTKFHVK